MKRRCRVCKLIESMISDIPDQHNKAMAIQHLAVLHWGTPVIDDRVSNLK